LDELNHTLDLELEADDADRISGWVTFHAGHIPKAGEIVEAQNCRVHVHRLRAHRIDQILLERLPDKIESQDDDAGWHENEEDA
jgi:CBS domain containing-hemolysin-like protein